MLTCLDCSDALVSKPITSLETANKSAIWFFIDLHSGSASRFCCVNLSSTERHSETYMSLFGRVEINKSQAHIESLWSDSAERWCASQSKMMRLFTMFLSLTPSALMQIVSSIKNETEPVTNLKHCKILWEIKL
jgi:hypothetical protein